MNKNVRICIGRLFRVSHRHAELLSGRKILGAHLVAVCDRKVERAEFLGKKI